jgi:hypothetical protein
MKTIYITKNQFDLDNKFEFAKIVLKEDNIQKNMSLAFRDEDFDDIIFTIVGVDDEKIILTPIGLSDEDFIFLKRKIHIKVFLDEDIV